MRTQPIILHARRSLTHTTIARIRGQIRRNPGAYDAMRRLYLRHARSGRPGHPKGAFETLRAASE
jgi:hypothetical protein